MDIVTLLPPVILSEVILHINGSHHNIDGIGNILFGYASCIHAGITYRL